MSDQKDFHTELNNRLLGALFFVSGTIMGMINDGPLDLKELHLIFFSIGDIVIRICLVVYGAFLFIRAEIRLKNLSKATKE